MARLTNRTDMTMLFTVHIKQQHSHFRHRHFMSDKMKPVAHHSVLEVLGPGIILIPKRMDNGNIISSFRGTLLHVESLVYVWNFTSDM